MLVDPENPPREPAAPDRWRRGEEFVNDLKAGLEATPEVLSPAFDVSGIKPAGRTSSPLLLPAPRPNEHDEKGERFTENKGRVLPGESAAAGSDTPLFL